MSKYNWDEKHIITFPEEKVVLSTKDLHVYYGSNESIKGVDMQFEKNKITALIGPSGSGKSTYLRSLNRMNDTIDIARVTGEIWYEGIDVNRPDINVYEMRKHIGMVFKSVCQVHLPPYYLPSRTCRSQRQEGLGRNRRKIFEASSPLGSGQG